MNPRGPCVSLRLEVGNTFLILRNFGAKWQKCISCRAILLRNVVLFCFDFSVNLLKSLLLPIMLHALFSVLGVPRKLKKSLLLPKLLRFDLGSSIKLLQSKRSITSSMWYDFTREVVIF